MVCPSPLWEYARHQPKLLVETCPGQRHSTGHCKINVWEKGLIELCILACQAPHTLIMAKHMVNRIHSHPQAHCELSLSYSVGIRDSCWLCALWMGPKYRRGAPPRPWQAATALPTSLPASPVPLATWLLLGGKTSLPMTGLLGLGGPSRWGGETALEVLGLGCSGELRANLASFPSSDSILMTFLGHWVWMHFLFWAVVVLETSCTEGVTEPGQMPPGVGGQSLP